MDLTLRPGVLEDAVFVADVATAMLPDDPVDRAVERYLWATSTPAQVVHRLIAELNGVPVGFVVTSHLDWPQLDGVRSGIVNTGLRPALFTPARLAQIIGEGLAVLKADGARRALMHARADQAALITAFTREGFRQDVPEKLWELDLTLRRARLLAVAEAASLRMANTGIDVGTVSTSVLADPIDQLYRLTREAIRDVPATVPVPELPRGLFDRWHSSPDVRWDRYWLATLDRRVVGLSYLRYPPAGGKVVTGFTATASELRGRGIALAVKIATLVQAMELGIQTVRTGNDSRNFAMLAINEKLGYHSLPASIPFFKSLE